MLGVASVAALFLFTYDLDELPILFQEFC